MADRVARRLGRWLTSRTRRNVWEPALQDLRADAARKFTRRGRSSPSVLRLVLLYIDCWRVQMMPAPSLIQFDSPHRSFRGEVTQMWQDIRHALRRLAHERAFTTAAVLTLTLGVGATVAVFAVVEAVLLRPLPYAAADELVILNHRDDRTGITKEFIAIGDFIDIAATQTTFQQLAAFNGGQSVIYAETPEPIVAVSLAAGPGLFQTLRIQPAHGRLLNDQDARQGAAPVAMLGYAMWQRHFKGDPGVVGRRIRVGGGPREIVGIAPEGFVFPANADAGTDIIVPLALPTAAPPERKSMWNFAVARLASSGIDGANTQLASISAQMERDHPTQNQGSRYYVTSMRDTVVGDTRRPLALLAAAVGAVLLIACANVGNLLLVRAIGRQQEMAVRSALGAGRGRMVGQVLIESAVLALVSAAGGLALAWWGTPALVALIPDSVNAPGLASVGLNLKVLGFALGVTTLAALTFGLISALASQNPAAVALASPGRAGVSRRVRRLTSGLVVAEVALAVVLLVGAGLVLRTFSSLMAIDPGFDVDRVVTFDIGLPSGRYPDAPARFAFYQRAAAAVRAIPGVEAVGMAAVTPLTGNNWTSPFERADRPAGPGQRPPDVGWQNASGGYFQALGIPLKSGRLFDHRDAPGTAPTVIISEAIEKRFFEPGESAVGRFIKQGNAQLEIVGVVGDIRRAALTDEPRMDLYLSFERLPANGITIFARSAGDPAHALPAVHAAFRQIEPNAVFINSRPLSETAARSIGTTRLTLWLLGVFAAIALALAGIGIYGVLSHAVRRRSREFGTRLALGARPRDILQLVLRWGATLAAGGIVIGAAAGMLASKSLESMLYGVTTTDLGVMAGAIGLLFLTALVASAIPARRAAKTDPARTLST